MAGLFLELPTELSAKKRARGWLEKTTEGVISHPPKRLVKLCDPGVFVVVKDAKKRTEFFLHSLPQKIKFSLI